MGKFLSKVTELLIQLPGEKCYLVTVSPTNFKK